MNCRYDTEMTISVISTLPLNSTLLTDRERLWSNGKTLLRCRRQLFCPGSWVRGQGSVQLYTCSRWDRFDLTFVKTRCRDIGMWIGL